MYRIRLHGRGGQGVKTAGRVLGTTFFLAGYEVQDAPLYGAERRGAPIFAYVRAGRRPIDERGPIRRPDLLVVADDTLFQVATAGLLAGLTPATVLLIHSHEPAESWQARLHHQGPLFVLPAAATEAATAGAACAGAAAALLGLPRSCLEQALLTELAGCGPSALEQGLAGYDSLVEQAGCVRATETAPATTWTPPPWIDLPLDDVAHAAPAIHAAATSLQTRTGLWRTWRPVIDYLHCHYCLICNALCPDGAISADHGTPYIDYEHCKGCLICAVQCPWHAIDVVPEALADAEEIESCPANC
jgi:pyruvate ferredoxin oxidoreductase gamma subunit